MRSYPDAETRAHFQQRMEEFGAKLIAVDPVDAQLQHRRRIHYQRVDTCTAPCWRNGGDYPCTCDDEHEGGTTAAPGGW